MTPWGKKKAGAVSKNTKRSRGRVKGEEAFCRGWEGPMA